jgi:hypothetical protein
VIAVLTIGSLASACACLDVRKHTEGIGMGTMSLVFTSGTCVLQLYVKGYFKKRVMFAGILFRYKYITLMFLEAELFYGIHV